MGTSSCGKRRVLGYMVATPEAEINWFRFLEELLARGLMGVKLIVADDHAGLKAARRAAGPCPPCVPWPRCPIHLQQNAGAFVTRQEARKTVAGEMRAIFNAPDRAEAERLLKAALGACRKEHPKAAEWAEEATPEGLIVYDSTAAHRIRLRTTNGLERLNRKLRRRTRTGQSPPTRIPVCALSALSSPNLTTSQTHKAYFNFNL